MKFPWTKVSPGQQLLADMKKSMISAMEEQMSFCFCMTNGTTEAATKKLFKTILGGKKVPLITADEKEDRAEQDRIYASTMSIVNGDRNAVQYPPDEIQMNAFTNDTLTEEEREEANDIIDIINEANQINRTGVYRTEESLRKETEEPNEEKPSSLGEILLNQVFRIVQPMINLSMSLAATMLTIAFMTKFIQVLEKL